MSRFIFLLGIFILSVTLLQVHTYALKHLLYFHIPWFDTFVHLLGGLTLGFLVLIPSSFVTSRKRTLYLVSVLGAFLFSIGWELFEYKIGMTFVSPKHLPLYIYDTITDVVCGTLGGLVAGYISGKILPIEHS